MDNEPPSTSDLIAQRVRELREDRGWKVADLARRCAEIGMPRLTAQVLYKLEGQRGRRAPRPVTVDELLVLAYALDIAPVHLIAGLDDSAIVPVTPEFSMRARSLRAWIRGFGSAWLIGADYQRYHANIPPDEKIHVSDTGQSDDLTAAAMRATTDLATTDLMIQALERSKSNTTEIIELLARIESARSAAEDEG